MQLHQFHINFLPAEDRILLRVNFRADDQSLHEVRAWLTRRIVRQLWPTLIQALESQVLLDHPGAANAREQMVSMAHQATMAAMEEAGHFGQAFEAAVGFPLGEIPMLVKQVNFGLNRGQPVKIEFVPEQGGGFDMNLSSELLHGLCRLLHGAVMQSEWDFDLLLPWADSGAEDEAPRVLN